MNQLRRAYLTAPFAAQKIRPLRRLGRALPITGVLTGVLALAACEDDDDD